mgnify:CR=1 FL=1
MTRRFDGDQGRRRLVDALAGQAVLRRHPELAAELAAVVEVRTHAPGEVLMAQGEDTDEVAFILDGRVDVLLGGQRIAERGPGDHVGEMAAIDPPTRRSATVRARGETVAAWVTEPVLATIAGRRPELWRAFARVLAARLRERERFHRPKNARPRVFLGSSTEAAQVIAAVRAALAGDDLELVPWNDGAFTPAHYNLESLEEAAARCDFAVLVAQGDDSLVRRGVTGAVPRDNVVFELGLFLGALGRPRALLMVPHGGGLQLPSDYVGVNTIAYPSTATGAPDVAEACAEIRRVIARLGTR